MQVVLKDTRRPPGGVYSTMAKTKVIARGYFGEINYDNEQAGYSEGPQQTPWWLERIYRIKTSVRNKAGQPIMISL